MEPFSGSSLRRRHRSPSNYRPGNDIIKLSVPEEGAEHKLYFSSHNLLLAIYIESVCAPSNHLVLLCIGHHRLQEQENGSQLPAKVSASSNN